MPESCLYLVNLFRGQRIESIFICLTGKHDEVSKEVLCSRLVDNPSSFSRPIWDVYDWNCGICCTRISSSQLIVMSW